MKQFKFHFLTVIALVTPFKLYARDHAGSNKSLTWEQVIREYQVLDAKYPQAALLPGGMTDIGKPLHLFVISADLDFNPVSIHKKGKAVFFINNAIHPGEPDGVDASLELAREVLGSGRYDSLLRHVVICIIPVYNIDGALNRGCCHRVNQEGPEEYGFRANARNLDLNRDYIKADAQNTRSFISLFRKWDPDVYADTHVSDGADYQYTMTLISSQHNKLFPVMGAYMKDKMTPGLMAMMKSLGTEICPYVSTRRETPDDGLEAFLETPRFGTGYAALFNTLGFVLESHMLKPFPLRMEATRQLLHVMLAYTASHAAEIIRIRMESNLECSRKAEFPLEWKLDTSQYEMISFRGYEAKHLTSEVTGLPRLWYDRSAPYEKPIPYYNTCTYTRSVDRPAYYVLPQAWQEVADRLKWNRINMIPLKKDTSIQVEVYTITDYQTTGQPYEGHYLHSRVNYRTDKTERKFYKGDWLIPVNQYANRYIVETLEPGGTDSFFAWGFFDSMLQQKEWFSDYVFEEKALELLKNRPELKEEFEKRKAADQAFASDHWAQLLYLYKQSPYFEKTLNQYPVYRINR